MTDAAPSRFESPASVRDGLRTVSYLADEGIAGVVFLAERLGKPILVEGPAGTGKTQLAKSIAELTGARLIRLQCYEGLDESKALYEWNYKKQLLRIQAQRVAEEGTGGTWTDVEDDIFSEPFLLTRPLLEAIRAEDPVVLLIDEVDRVEVETEALLLEILSDYQVSIPELGTVSATQIPLVFLTSNNTRELSEALKRRCLFLHIDYPDIDREKEIVLTRVPGISEALADQIVRIVRSIRSLELKKAPSVSETLDWARTLLLLGIESVDAATATETLHILLKYQSDIDKAAKDLFSIGGAVGVPEPGDTTEHPGEVLPLGSSAGLLEVLSGFVKELRSAGIPVSLTENLDSVEALRHIPLDDREAFKYTLAATMVKNNSHWKTFETVFEVYFSFRGREYRLGDTEGGAEAEEMITSLIGPPGDGQGSAEGLTPEQLAEMLYRALMDGNEALMRALARAAVTRYAGMEPGRPVGGTYYLYRTLRQLDLDSVLQRMMEQEHGRADVTDLEERLAREEYEARLNTLRREIEAEIRRRLVADRGAEAVAKSVRKPLPEDIDFMHASREELVALRKAIAPLTRKLAVRLAQKRRHGRKGPLDFRSTVRHSLSYGGVPADPKFRYPRPSKPEIMVIADISGSVAAFARFTLQMVYAISSQFSRVRSFVFIDGIDEVTDYFRATEDIGEAIHRINTEADVIWVDGHSDYGHAFEAFWDRWGRDVNTKSTVLLLGDARNNYHAAQAWVLAEMQKKARHVYWLNPEPRSYWDTGDSIVGQYSVHCDGAYECRNLKQLERFVEQLG